MNKVPTEEKKYVLMFHGDVPGILMAHVACRRTGGQTARGLHARKVINCPHCTKPFTDIDRDAKVELYCYPAKKQMRCHVYPICHNCGNEVGMILV